MKCLKEQSKQMNISDLPKAIVIAASTTFPLQGCAEETVQSEEQLVAELKGEVEALFDRFSPVPFQAMRKVELDEILTGVGYTGQDLGSEYFYSRTVPVVSGVRTPQYQVIVKYCGTSSNQNPWVKSVAFLSSGIQGVEPQDFIDQIQAASVLPRVAQILEDDGSSFVSFQAQLFPSEKGEIFVASGKAQTSDNIEANQKIELNMEVACPTN